MYKAIIHRLLMTDANHVMQTKGPAVLVGSSINASTVIDFALHHPEATAKLVLMGPAAWNEGLGLFPWLPRPLAILGTKARCTCKSYALAFLSPNNIMFGGCSLEWAEPLSVAASPYQHSWNKGELLWSSRLRLHDRTE